MPKRSPITFFDFVSLKAPVPSQDGMGRMRNYVKNEIIEGVQEKFVGVLTV